MQPSFAERALLSRLTKDSVMNSAMSQLQQNQKTSYLISPKESVDQGGERPYDSEITLKEGARKEKAEKLAVI